MIVAAAAVWCLVATSLARVALGSTARWGGTSLGARPKTSAFQRFKQVRKLSMVWAGTRLGSWGRPAFARKPVT